MSHYIKAVTDFWIAVAIQWQVAVLDWERLQGWRE